MTFTWFVLLSAAFFIICLLLPRLMPEEKQRK